MIRRSKIMYNTLLVGIDEAGRGPCIGPMVIAGTCVDIKKLPQLNEIGVKDSKQLAPKKRLKIAEKLKDIVEKVEIYIIPGPKITKNKLIQLELEGIACIIKSLQASEYIIDTPVNPLGINKFLSQLRALIGDNKSKIRIEPKADNRYLVVGAASIFAKVRRDQEIEILKEKYGDLGSGYPSDQKTINFLENNKNNRDKINEIIRPDWETVRRIFDSCQLNLKND